MSQEQLGMGHCSITNQFAGGLETESRRGFLPVKSRASSSCPYFQGALLTHGTISWATANSDQTASEPMSRI